MMLKLRNYLGGLKEKILIKCFCKKVDYVKMSVFDKILAYSLTFLYFAIYISILFLIPILYFINSVDVNKFIDSILSDNINEIALTLYGLQLTIFSILIALKHKKIYDVSELKIGMKISRIGLNINYFIVMSNLYLVFYIIDVALGNDSKKAALFLIIYSTVSLLKCSSLMQTSTAQIYYKYKCDHINNNVLFRKKGNILSIIKNSENNDYFTEMSNQAIDKELLKIIDYFNSFKKNIFYNINNDFNDEFELFELYLHKYFKSIKNDAQLFGTLHTFIVIRDILDTLLKNKKYLEFENLFQIILLKYNNLLDSRNVKRRFAKTRKFPLVEDNQKVVSGIYLRNTYLLIAFNINYNLLKGLDDKNKEAIEKFILEESKAEIRKKISKIQEIVKEYERNNNELFQGSTKLIEND